MIEFISGVLWKILINIPRSLQPHKQLRLFNSIETIHSHLNLQSSDAFKQMPNIKKCLDSKIFCSSIDWKLPIQFPLFVSVAHHLTSFNTKLNNKLQNFSFYHTKINRHCGFHAEFSQRNFFRRAKKNRQKKSILFLESVIIFFFLTKIFLSSCHENEIFLSFPAKQTWNWTNFRNLFERHGRRRKMSQRESESEWESVTYCIGTSFDRLMLAVSLFKSFSEIFCDLLSFSLTLFQLFPWLTEIFYQTPRRKWKLSSEERCVRGKAVLLWLRALIHFDVCSLAFLSHDEALIAFTPMTFNGLSMHLMALHPQVH